ncbi:MAG: hypothetical protein ACKN9P_00595 [Phenylobacterium sp.]
MSFGEIAFQIVIFALAIAIPSWAMIAGGRAERICALIFVVATVASKSVEQVFPIKHAGTIFLTIDGLMALGFLALAMIYGHLWIALMMVAMAGFFSIHAFYEMTNRDLDWTFALTSNLATVILMASLAIGVWTSRRRAAEEA